MRKVEVGDAGEERRIKRWKMGSRELLEREGGPVGGAGKGKGCWKGK